MLGRTSGPTWTTSATALDCRRAAVHPREAWRLAIRKASNRPIRCRRRRAICWWRPCNSRRSSRPKRIGVAAPVRSATSTTAENRIEPGDGRVVGRERAGAGQLNTTPARLDAPHRAILHAMYLWSELVRFVSAVDGVSRVQSASGNTPSPACRPFGGTSCEHG